MIDLIVQKSYSCKDNKFKLNNNTILYDLTKVSKFTSFTINKANYNIDYNNNNKSNLQKTRYSYKSNNVELPSIKINKLITSNNHYKNNSILYVGMTNGNIARINLNYSNNIINNSINEISLLECNSQFKHKGNVNCLIIENIENSCILFSGGADSTIKIWNCEIDEIKYNKSNYIKTILGHKGSILSLVYCKSKSILVSSSTDETIKIWKMDDNFDKIINPLFQCINTIKKFGHSKVSSPFWINHLSIKETDTIELFAADTEGFIHVYEYYEETGRYISSSRKNKNFNYLNSFKNHKMGCLKVVHSSYESTLYSISYDNKLVSYNLKERKKYLDILNNKCFYTDLDLNKNKQEIIASDEKGYITFVKVFNHTETKVKYKNSRIDKIIIYNSFNKGDIINTNSNIDSEYLILLSAEFIDIVKIKRESKTVNIQLHNGEIFKIYTIDPVLNDKNEIIEDTKIITAGRDNSIKFWDFLSMEHIHTIEGPESSLKIMEISAICYISSNNIIVLGTNTGEILFWDLINYKYLNSSTLDAGLMSYVTYIYYTLSDKGSGMTFVVNTKGYVFVYELEKLDIKYKALEDINSLDNNNYFSKDTAQNINKLMDVSILNKSHLDKMTAKEFNYLREYYNKLEISRKELKNKNNIDINNNNNNKTNNIRNKIIINSNNINFVYAPNLRFTLNSEQIIKISKNDLSDNNINNIHQNSHTYELYTVIYYSKNNTIYTGGNSGKIYCWNFEVGSVIAKLNHHKGQISCMILDKNLLITGDKEGVICIWSADKNFLLFTLFNKNNNNPRIIDLCMLVDYGLLVSLNSFKQIEFWIYEKQKLIKAKPLTKEVCCFSFVNYYGKLLCGALDYTILEEDLISLFDELNLQHNFSKFPFLNNKNNYTSNPYKEYENHQIMKSINNEVVKY